MRTLLFLVACTCIAPGTDEEETRRADVVFVGTVTSIAEPKPGQPNTFAGGRSRDEGLHRQPPALI